MSYTDGFTTSFAPSTVALLWIDTGFLYFQKKYLCKKLNEGKNQMKKMANDLLFWFELASTIILSIILTKATNVWTLSGYIQNLQ